MCNVWFNTPVQENGVNIINGADLDQRQNHNHFQQVHHFAQKHEEKMPYCRTKINTFPNIEDLIDWDKENQPSHCVQ